MMNKLQSTLCQSINSGKSLCIGCQKLDLSNYHRLETFSCWSYLGPDLKNLKITKKTMMDNRFDVYTTTDVGE